MKYYISLSILVVSLLTNGFQWNENHNMDELIENNQSKISEMNKSDLGAFSVSLSVKDLAASKLFYENLGFEVLAGGKEMNYYIMKNGDTLIGIFHGMFEGNIMTFNPGWDSNAQNLDEFVDVRDIHKNLQEKDVRIMDGASLDGKGPGSFMVSDPDGNIILIDQHR